MTLLHWLAVSGLCLAAFAFGAEVMRLVIRRRADALLADPGPLDDAGLRRALADPRLGPASPLRDRVQDAFERLLRERDAARKS